MLIWAIAMQMLVPPISGTTVPSHGVNTATGCFDDNDSRAWIGIVPNGDHRTVYLMNYSHVHDAGDIDLESSLTELASDRWELVLTTMPGDDAKEVPEGCQPRTTIDASVALPTTAQSLTVKLDGDVVITVQTTAVSPRFAYLE